MVDRQHIGIVITNYAVSSIALQHIPRVQLINCTPPAGIPHKVLYQASLAMMDVLVQQYCFPGVTVTPVSAHVEVHLSQPCPHSTVANRDHQQVCQEAGWVDL